MYQEYRWNSDQNRLAIPGRIYNRLLSFQQHEDSALESGGLLMGRRIVDSRDCIVDEITTPMFGDIQRKNYFFRGKSHLAKQKEYWDSTGTTGQLLGVWHTHPEPDPTPSGTDYNDWRTVIKKCGVRNKPLFFIIIGQEHVRVWLGFKRALMPPKFLACTYQGDNY